LATLSALAPTVTLPERLSAGEGILTIAAKYASSRLDPDQAIRTVVSEKSGAQALVDLSEHAALIVCQRRAVLAAHRGHTGSMTSRVCAQSDSR